MKHLNIYNNMTEYNAVIDNLPITHVAKIIDTEEVIGYPDEEMIAVEYLQGDGSAWIDTGVVIKDNPRVVINIYMTGSLDKDVFGFPSNTQPSFIGNISASSSKQSFQYYRYYTTSSRGSALNSTVPFNTWAEWDMSNVVKCNGTTLATYNRESFAANNQTLRLFNGRGYITTNVVRVGATKIYDGDVLKRDFIPVRLGNVGYMYDRVSKRLFGNKGSGAFTYGQDIFPINYLETSGTQRIHTGIRGNVRVFGEAEATVTKGSSQTLICSIASGSGACWFGEATTTQKWGVGGSTGQYVNVSPLRRVQFRLNFDDSGISGDIALTPPISHSETEGKLPVSRLQSTIKEEWSIFDTTSGSYPFTGKLYRIKFWQNSVLVRDYIPVRVGTTGYLLDKVNWKLYGNDGTGSFTFGADVVNIEKSQTFIAG